MAVAAEVTAVAAVADVADVAIAAKVAAARKRPRAAGEGCA